MKENDKDTIVKYCFQHYIERILGGKLSLSFRAGRRRKDIESQTEDSLGQNLFSRPGAAERGSTGVLVTRTSSRRRRWSSSCNTLVRPQWNSSAQALWTASRLAKKRDPRNAAMWVAVGKWWRSRASIIIDVWGHCRCGYHCTPPRVRSPNVCRMGRHALALDFDSSSLAMKTM